MWREHKDLNISSPIPKVEKLKAPAIGCTKSHGRRVPQARPLARTRQEHVCARHAVLDLQPRAQARPRADRAHLRQEGQGDRVEREAARGGYAWAEANLDFKYRIPAQAPTEPNIVVNGNTALALGVLASGMEICAMYPITPATSASHYLSDVFEKVAASCTRPKTRSLPARSPLARPTRASAP